MITNALMALLMTGALAAGETPAPPPHPHGIMVAENGDDAATDDIPLEGTGVDADEGPAQTIIPQKQDLTEEELEEELKRINYEDPLEVLKARKLVIRHLRAQQKRKEQSLENESDEEMERILYSNSVDDWIRRNGGAKYIDKTPGEPAGN